MDRCTCPEPQRGAATLTLAATLLLAAGLVALFTHQRLWFEQQASSNQIRAIQAAELAQAGLDWATAQLNSSTLLGDPPSCVGTLEAAGGQTFRERYVSPRAASNGWPRGLFPPANAHAGCTLANDGALRCTCPQPGQPVALGSGHFAVAFVPHPDDPLAIELRSTGRPDNGDTRAQARQILKLAPALVHPPPAAVLAGGHIHATGPLRATHADAALPGLALRAGGDITTSADTVLTLAPERATAPAAVQQDPVLRQLSSHDSTGGRFFEVITGRTLSGYLSDPLTTVIDQRHCDSPAACGAWLIAMHHRGGRQFWVGADVTLTATDAPQLGSFGRPVLIASAGTVVLRGQLQIHGLLLTGQLRVEEASSGAASVVGAVAVRGDVVTAGAFTATADRSVLGMAGGAPMGTLIPVPGTWRDRFAPY